MKEKGALETPLASALISFLGALENITLAQFLVTLPRSPSQKCLKARVEGNFETPLLSQPALSVLKLG